MIIMTITTTAIIPPITPPAIAPALLPPLLPKDVRLTTVASYNTIAYFWDLGLIALLE